MTNGLRALIALLAFGLLQFRAAALAQMQYENFLVGLPDGFKIGFQARKGDIGVSKMIPAAETLDNWTQMVTVQIFFGPSP